MPFGTTQDPTEAGEASAKVRQQSPYSQALELQRIALRDCRDDETTPAQRAQAMRAWCDLEDRKRIIKGKGLPKSVPANNEPRKSKRSAASPVEPGGNARPIAEPVKPEQGE